MGLRLRLGLCLGSGWIYLSLRQSRQTQQPAHLCALRVRVGPGAREEGEGESDREGEGEGEGEDEIEGEDQDHHLTAPYPLP